MAISYIPFNKTAEFEMGSEGEQLVKKLLQESGWFVIPSYAYTGPEGDKAPKMEGLRTYFVIPDLDICKTGTRRWIEVKTKTEATFTRITQRYEHGIPLRHYYIRRWAVGVVDENQLVQRVFNAARFVETLEAR